jgi:hypothetical protein
MGFWGDVLRGLTSTIEAPFKDTSTGAKDVAAAEVPGLEPYAITGEAATAAAKNPKFRKALVGAVTGKPSAADPSKGKGKGGGGGKMSEQDALKELANYLLQNYASNLPAQGEIAAGEEGQQLANQNAAVTNAVSSELGTAAASATASGDPAVAAAMNAYNTAYQTGEGFNSAAYQNMGLANQQFMQSSPLGPIANMLASGLGSNYYKQLPPALVQNLPASVKALLNAQGVGESQPPTSPILTTGGGTGGTTNNYSALINALQKQNAITQNQTNPNPTGGGNPNNPTT